MARWKCDFHTLYTWEGSREDTTVRPTTGRYAEALERLHHTPRPLLEAPCPCVFAAALAHVVTGKFELAVLSGVRSDVPPKAA